MKILENKSYVDIHEIKKFETFSGMRGRVLDAGSDSVGYFGGKFEGGYYIQQSPSEFAALCCFLKENKSDMDLYGEIGSASGGNLRFIRENVGFKKAVSIDNKMHKRHIYQDENFSNFKDDLIQIIGDSHSDEIKNELENGFRGNSFDCWFIDGDHSFDGVVKDTDLVLPFSNDNTFFIYHDTLACAPNVGRAVDEMVSSGKLKLIAHFASTDIGEKPSMGIAVCQKS